MTFTFNLVSSSSSSPSLKWLSQNIGVTHTYSLVAQLLQSHKPNIQQSTRSESTDQNKCHAHKQIQTMATNIPRSVFVGWHTVS